MHADELFHHPEPFLHLETVIVSQTDGKDTLIWDTGKVGGNLRIHAREIGLLRPEGFVGWNQVIGQ